MRSGSSTGLSSREGQREDFGALCELDRSPPLRRHPPSCPWITGPLVAHVCFRYPPSPPSQRVLVKRPCVWQVLDRLLRRKNAEKRLIVFCQHSDAVQLVVRHLEGTGVNFREISGQTNAMSDGEALSWFNQQGPSLRVLVLSQYCGRGINAPAADLVVFFDSVASRALYDQNVRSALRWGRQVDAQLKIILLLTPGTIEEGRFHKVW